MKPIYIAAYHQSKFGKLMGMTVPSIVTAPVEGACGEIGVDGIRAGRGVDRRGLRRLTLNGQGLLAGLMADVAGLAGKPIEAVENACASGGQAVLSVIQKLQLRHWRNRHRDRV